MVCMLEIFGFICILNAVLDNNLRKLGLCCSLASIEYYEFYEYKLVK